MTYAKTYTGISGITFNEMVVWCEQYLKYDNWEVKSWDGTIALNLSDPYVRELMTTYTFNSVSMMFDFLLEDEYTQFVLTWG
jgi:hypothetical protein